MQELRFVGVEDDWLIVTNDRGERFRLRADDPLREAVRPRPAPRAEGPRVPPRMIQQLIRAGKTVEEVVVETGAEAATVQRFEAPIRAERAYIVEQARAVPVRVQQGVDPLAAESATFGVAIDGRLESLASRAIHWDAWKDPDAGWHIGLDFVTDDVARSALWKFDPRSNSLQPSSPAAITLSQQDEPSSLAGPHLRVVKTERSGPIIPIEEHESRSAHGDERRSPTTHETADLLEALRRRRGERQHSTYFEEAELSDEPTTELGYPEPESYDFTGAPLGDADSTANRVTPFARPATAMAETDEDAAGSADEEALVEPADPTVDEDSSNRSEVSASDETTARESRIETVPQLPFEGMEVQLPPAPPRDRRKVSARRGGRPTMPSWDDIVFGTRTEDD